MERGGGMEGRKANRLASERSPYLKQHAYNPVDWRPWSEETLAEARGNGMPIFLSIGYSTCHWCHVMERESFEDPETASLMNGAFICIKVDREERPDVDSLYMKAVQAMTGRGGWPLNVFCTAEGVPFYGGTYFPPEDSHGMPAFKKVLAAVSQAYGDRGTELEAMTKEIVAALDAGNAAGKIELAAEMREAAFEAAKHFFDPASGGFGSEMKFPYSMFLKFLFRYQARTGSEEALGILDKTLSAMARGGINDQLGGGFHRYTVDADWEVPHFEKMLYDNGQLLELYSVMYAKTGTPLYAKTVRETAEYLLREMRSKDGAFYAASDADSGGGEGEYFVWGVDEVEGALGKEDGRLFMDYFSMTPEGNFEGRNTLRVAPGRADEDERLKALRAKLLAVRSGRTAPAVDKKVIAGWNGLAIAGLAEASRAIKEPALLDAARACAAAVLKGLRDEKGRLRRYGLDGMSDAPGGLEDYALLGVGLMALYAVDKNEKWLVEADRLAAEAVALFQDQKTGLFYDSGSDAPRLFVRERDLVDGDLPSGQSAAADLFLRLARAGKARYAELPASILSSIDGMATEPLSHGNALAVLEEMAAEKG